jgi:eukaryotic-like serine/threonine-protein kinase
MRWAENDAPAACPTDGSALVRPRDLVDSGDDPMVGRTLEGRYTILARLGAGSMGTVYRAKQHAMGREVAIKILRGDRAVDESAKARFMREARANSLLASPNTVTVFDFGQSESGEFYLAMELLDGESLGQRLARVGRLPAPVAADAARQALRSLAEAHAKGIIHRDLKPDNLFFARVLTGTMRSADVAGVATTSDAHEEIVKVLDFGIAKMLRDEDGQPMGVVETQAGTVFGTPRYMSPEQAQGKPLDPRSDLYALGVILYQMLAGRAPFTDNDAVVVMARHIKSTPKRPSEVCPEAAIPKELEDVVMRTLAKDPAERPASAEVLAGELLAALEAQGSLTSGVRASVTNAAGIRIPDSMRPPAVLLPPARKPFPVLLVAIPLAVLAAGAGVYLGLTRTTAPSSTEAEPLVHQPMGSASAPETPPAEAASSGLDDVDTPTFTPDNLPSAQTPPAAGKPQGRPARPRPPAAAPRASSTAPTPSPAAPSPYGIFE